MITHIALLRGINVGDNMLKMERLRQIFAELGLIGAKTYLQSGNVLFRAKGTSAELGVLIGKPLAAETRLPVSVLVRTPAQLRHIIDANPFLRETGVDATKLHVTFLAGRPSRSGLAALGAIKSGADRWHAAGDAIYLLCPDGYGRSKLSNTTIERLLSMRATTRNWNTVKALWEMSQE